MDANTIAKVDAEITKVSEEKKTLARRLRKLRNLKDSEKILNELVTPNK